MNSFGAAMPGRTYPLADGYRYGFNGKEKDTEIKGEGNSYDYGFRMYDPRLGQFLTADPLAYKYSDWSPYVFCYDSPLSVVDLDGNEGIVISGAPGNPDDGGHKNKEHFLINGLDRAKDAQKHTKRKGEKVTWIIYNGGGSDANHDPKMLAKYIKKAKKAGINVMVVNNVDDIVTYVNEKTGGDSRAEDQITSFYYVGHATPGDLDVGYAGTGEDFDPSDLNPAAFNSGCYVNLVGGCRTSVPGVFEDSNVTQFQENVDEKSTIKGSDVRVTYSGGVKTDAELVAPNKGNVERRRGKKAGGTVETQKDKKKN